MDDISLVGAILENAGLGAPLDIPSSVSGGYMHRMYRAVTEKGDYAVKLLDPEVMARPDAAENYARAEAIEDILEKNGVPAVTAIKINGRKLQQFGERRAYIFPWFDGWVVPWEDITPAHCRSAGALLASLHSITRRYEKTPECTFCPDWDALACAARSSCPALFPALCENLPLIKRAQKEYIRAMSILPPVATITNGDMDCKNVMWDENGPRMIDLECLDYANPVSDMLVLAFSWAGGQLCSIDPEKLDAFLDAYLHIFSAPECDLCALYAVGYSWLEWLEYNVRRASGLIASDEAGRSAAADESLATIRRIVHHSHMEKTIVPILRKWSTGETHK